jgi:hypothetical protein
MGLKKTTNSFYAVILFPLLYKEGLGVVDVTYN